MLYKWILTVLVAFLLFPSITVHAEELTPQVSGQGSSITVTAKNGASIGAVYVKWNKAVSPYELITDTQTLSCGQNGFLHEFIPLETPSTSLTFSLPAENPMDIYAIRLFTDTDVPEDVQIWEPPCERADILLISSHADDEILFMGGIIPTYSVLEGARVQVAYMTEFWTTTPVREHEKLDGLWTDGLRTYPVCGNFPDIYTENLADAEKKYDLAALTDYAAEIIDRFQPQVVVTHDFNGEYGHGFHQITAKAVAAALDQASWSVPKAYFHLYAENKIHMDLHVPIESMGGKTALDIAKDAYLQHKSQQWCWFYVSDTYKYSCADFGLYRSTVGADTTDSMLDNLVLYDEQDRIEAERLEAQRQEEEQRRLQEEQEELARFDEEWAGYQRQAEQNALDAAEELEQIKKELEDAKARTTLVLLIGCILLLLCITYLIYLMLRRPRRHE